MKTAFARIAAALCMSAPLVATAAIAPGNVQSGGNVFYNGNGELFLAVFDSTAKVSYAFDLGITQNEFQALHTDAGFQRFWEVADANWSSFLTQVDASRLRWLVNAFDIVGGTAVGQLRWFTTLDQEDFDPSDSLIAPGFDPTQPTALSSMTNQLFQNGIGAPQAGTFFNTVNNTGTHVVNGSAINFAANGSSVNLDSDSGNAYVADGSVGLSTTLNGNARGFSSGNAVGRSSWFYYVTRSGGNQLAGALVDEFDNLTADGYFGFIFVDPALYPNSPYVGKYLLSYTLAGSQLTPAQRVFAQSIGRTELGGGFRITKLAGVAASGGETPAVWQTLRLGSAAGGAGDLGAQAILSPVPEPGTWALMAGGLVAVAALAKRRRRAAPDADR